MAKKANDQVEFAKRHLTKEITTFDAYSAIYRLELLLDDVEQLKPILEPILAARWFPAFFEFTSFYKVGYVTCLGSGPIKSVADQFAA